MKLSQRAVIETFNYDLETGIFRWKDSPSSKVPAGSVAGTLREEGFMVIGYKKKQYRVDKLAWLYVHGDYPTQRLVHKNGDLKDNRISNLSLNVEDSDTMEEVVSFSIMTTAKGGVSKKWFANAKLHGKLINIGVYDTKSEAKLAYINYKYKNKL